MIHDLPSSVTSISDEYFNVSLFLSQLATADTSLHDPIEISNTEKFPRSESSFPNDAFNKLSPSNRARQRNTRQIILSYPPLLRNG